MKSSFLLLFCGICSLIVDAQLPNVPVYSSGVLKNVVVFRSSAKLEHQAKAGLKAGDSELIIEGISSQLDLNSIQVKCPSTVTILSMEFSNNFLRPEILSSTGRKVKDSLDSVEGALKRTQTQIAINHDLLALLKQNQQVKGEQTGLAVAELMKLMEYYKSKMTAVNEELLTLQEKLQKQQQVFNTLTTQLNEEKKKNTTTGGRLILQLTAALAGQFEFQVSYVTYNAFWTPFYDIKADNIKSPLKFNLKGKIAQTTGIDWKQVKLTLSTAAPTQYGNAPLLKTWFLGFVDPYRLSRYQGKQNVIQSLGREMPMAESSLDEVVVVGKSANKFRSDEKPAPVYIINGATVNAETFNQINRDLIAATQVLQPEQAEQLYGADAAGGAIIVTLKDDLSDFVAIGGGELEVSYDIDLAYDVPTNGKPQIASLSLQEVPALYKYYTVPKLDKEVYLLAEVPNWQNLNLLPGEANIVFEGTYIGKTMIDPANTGDTLNLTLGTDKRIVVKREKLQDFSSSKFIGTNRVQSFTYEISVRNSKQDPIAIIVKDQIPISTTNEIEVTSQELSGGSKNDETGVVTWMLNLDAGTSKKLRLGYNIKYPREKTINLQ